MAAGSESLLDFAQPLDVPLLDDTVSAFYSGDPAQVKPCNMIMVLSLVSHV